MTGYQVEQESFKNFTNMYHILFKLNENCFLFHILPKPGHSNQGHLIKNFQQFNKKNHGG